MNLADRDRVQSWLDKWQNSHGNERANYQTFFQDWCIALGVESPPPKGNIEDDPYCFDKEIKFVHSDRENTTKFADFYKAGHFLTEAKQGGNSSGKGTAKRGTEGYRKAIEKAFYQVRAYAQQLDNKPPFLITCDIGTHFELWMSFSGNYGGYGAREKIELVDFLKPEVFDRFVLIFTDPQQLNPDRYRARVTREVAKDLAELAQWLEQQNLDSQQAAQFLMRCIFTMFAEDVKLLPEELFTKGLTERWISHPHKFKSEIETLWQTMNTGGMFGFEHILKFNGSFFADAIAFELPAAQLKILLQAAEKDWSQVEPAIFGTLLERALNPKERSKLGAHYTPRAYVERLVYPVVIEPLREQWQGVELEVDRLLTPIAGKDAPTAKQREKATTEIKDFLTELRQIKILDPACGSGNFLYVTLDLIKTLEAEVITRLVDIFGATQLDIEQVDPSQFLGIEINPRAAAIAELVIWIGYLQWYFKRFGNTAPPEPILQAFNNIEHRDAVLEYDSREIAINPNTNQPRTRWGGKLMKHPVTGEDVPDPSDQIPIYKYLNPRPSEWQSADYIVSNPPFIGNARMRDRLGDGYAETLRSVYKDVPDTVDFVMYWWHKSAELVRAEKVKRFGLITTNSISQVRQRSVIDFHLNQKNPIKLIFAIPDHPWADGDAAVRIAMITTELDSSASLNKYCVFGEVTKEIETNIPEHSAETIDIAWKNVDAIYSNIESGFDPGRLVKLNSNLSISGKGMQMTGGGFIVTLEQAESMGYSHQLQTPVVIKKYLSGRDITDIPRNLYTIDLFGLKINEVQSIYPSIYQWIVERVKPERDTNNRKSLRDNWWIYGEARATFRPGFQNISRYIATPRTAKHRFFIFVDQFVISESEVVAIASSDAYHLGTLSSKAHVVWALVAGSRLGVGNTPRYNNSICFDPFPFPDPNEAQKQTIRELGERLDAHRKRVQTSHPDITITGMYNLLEKLSSGEQFTDKDKAYNQRALVSTLKQIHDELDTAVFAAYGWKPHLSDEEILTNLVQLNTERAAEERNGLIRWLRPEYQAPTTTATQQTLIDVESPPAALGKAGEERKWSKQPKEQLTAIQELLSTTPGEWTLAQIAAQFKGAARQQQAIQDNLERLEWFGLVLNRREADVIYWRFGGG